MARRAPRNRVVRLRLSDVEWLALAAVCAERNTTMSTALRRGARAAGGLGPTFDGATRLAILETNRQLRAIGVNLNQTARALNRGIVPAHAQLKAVIEPLIAAIADTQEAYLSLCAAAQAKALEATD